MADLIAIDSAQGVNEACARLLKKLRPEESPLYRGRDELIKHDFEPPVISDEWWLDIIELMESEIIWRNSCQRWLFPLPHRGYVTGKKRGINIAWAAMQLEWSNCADEQKICQITRPEVVHDFINRFPGLSDLCHEHSDHLACYVPQLVIPEFSGPFSDDFDAMLRLSELEQEAKRKNDSTSGIALTADAQIPLCDEVIALRHPNFGNYRPGPVASKYVQSYVSGSRSSCFDPFDYLVWLLSDESKWLPARHREFLTVGMREWAA